MSTNDLRKDVAGRILGIGKFLVENHEELAAGIDVGCLDSVDLSVDLGLPGSLPTVGIDKAFIVLPRDCDGE